MSDTRPALGFLCRRILLPLVRILIRFGISAGEFKAIVDSVYAHAGSEYLAKRGERVTYSKLAVITGINRAFLPTILANPEDDFYPRSNTQLHRAARVLNGWYDDRQFQTASGEPAVLPIDDAPHSFRHLVELYSGGVYHQTILSELERVGAIRLLSGGRIKAMRRNPISRGANVDSVLAIAETAGDVLNTLEHNLTSPDGEQMLVRVRLGDIDLRSLPLFRRVLDKRAERLFGQVDQFIRAHGADPGRAVAGNACAQVGAVLVAIRRKSSKQMEAESSASPERRNDR